MSLYGLDRTPAEIAAEYNLNFQKANPDTIELWKRIGVSVDVYSPTDQLMIDISNREAAQEKDDAKQALLAKQNKDIEDALVKQRDLNTQLANAKTLQEQQNISDQIRNLTEKTINPKLISLTQNTIDYINSNSKNDGLTNQQRNDMVNTLAKDTTSSINYGNSTLNYIDAAIQYAASPKTETDAAKLQTVVNDVNQKFDTWATDAEKVQNSITNVENTVQAVLLSQHVDTTNKATTTKAVTTQVTDKKMVWPTPVATSSTGKEDFVFTETTTPVQPAQQSNVLPLIAVAAALYFGLGG